MRSRNRPAVAVITATVCVAVVGGCSNSGGGSSPSMSATTSTAGSSPTGLPSRTVSSASAPLGKILVDGRGRTLYLFEADASSRSKCSGGCASAWPPMVVSGKPTAAGGARGGLLATTTRSGDVKQVTYNGHPLYYYSGDQKAGDTNGQGLDQFGAKWYVLDASGNRVTSAPPTSGGGY